MISKKSTLNDIELDIMKKDNNKRLKKSDSPSVVMVNTSSKNFRLADKIQGLENEREMLVDILNKLNEKIVKDNDVIAGLRSTFNEISSNKQTTPDKIKKNVNISPINDSLKFLIENLTEETIPETFRKYPFLFSDFWNKTSVCTEIGLYLLDTPLFTPYIREFMYQIDLISKVILSYRRITNNTVNDTFLYDILLELKSLVDLERAYMFVRDSLSSDFSVEFGELIYYFSLSKPTSLPAKSYIDQRTYSYSKPDEAHCYSIVVDKLLNPSNNHVITVPIGHDGVFYIVCSEFQKINIDVATLFATLVQPLLHEHIDYIHMIRSVKVNRSLLSFKIKLLAMTSFDKLIPFLYETLMFDLDAGALDFFIINEDKVIKISYNDNDIVKRVHNQTGIAYNVSVQKKIFNFERVQTTTVFYDDEVDSYSLHKSLCLYPILSPSCECLAVLSLLDKKTSNKFNSWDIEYLRNACAALALVVPSCIELLIEKNNKFIRESLELLPSSLSNYTYQELSTKNAVKRLAHLLRRIISAERIFIFKLVGDTVTKVIHLNNDIESEESIIPESYIKELFLSVDELTFLKNLQQLSPSLNLDLKRIAGSRVSNKEMTVLVISFNHESEFQSSDTIKIIAFNVLYSLTISYRNDSLESLYKFIDFEDSIFKKCIDASMSEDPLRSLVSTFSEMLTTTDWVIFKHIPLNKAYYPFLSASDKVYSRVPDDDPLAVCLRTSSEETVVKDPRSSDFSESQFVAQMRTSLKYMVFAPLGEGGSYGIIMTGSTLIDGYKELFGYFCPVILDFANTKSIQYDSGGLLNDQLSFNSSEITIDEIADKLFQISKYNEAQKIDIVVKIFVSFDILTFLNVNVQSFTNLILEIRGTYGDYHYHNWDHAITTLQFTFSVMHRGKLKRLYNGQSLCAILFAALCHDLNYPGYSSNMIKKYKKPQYYIYGENDPAEKASMIALTNILVKHKFAQEYLNQEFWTLLKVLIESTNIEYQISINNEFEPIIKTFSTASHKITLAKFLVSVANFSNVVRVYPEYKACVENMNKEVEEANKYNNADEKIYNNSNNVTLDRIETDFLDEIAIPSLQLLCKFVPDVQDFLIQAQDNRKQWTEQFKVE